MINDNLVNVVIEAGKMAFESLAVAVDGVSLDLEEGERVALIGPNGAGKTTLFNLVSGLFPTDSGTIKLNGREIGEP